MAAAITPESKAPPEPHSRFSLLATAVAGRHVDVAIDQFRCAYTNGRVVFLPEGDPRMFLTGLIVQSALLAAGSLEPSIVVRLMGRRRIAARYLMLEAVRALRLLDGCAPPAIERTVMTMAAGVATTRSAQESLARAQSDTTLPEAPDVLGMLRPSKVLGEGGLALAGAALKPGSQGEDKRREKIEIPEADDEDDAEESSALKLMSMPGSGDNFLSRFLRNNVLKLGRTKSEGGQAGDDLPVGSMTAVSEVGEHAQAASKPPGVELSSALSQAAVRKVLYPEWDYERAGHKQDWCAVVEYDPPSAGGEKLQLTPDPMLERSLARMGLAFETHDRREDGDNLDLHALVEMAVARAAGESSDGRVYQSRLHTGHDLGVVVVIDASGSTAERRENDHAVWDGQRRLAANLISGLERVGERVAAFGFRSHGRHDVRFLRIKDFDDRFGGAAKARLEALKPGGFTRLGAAIRHGAQLVRDKSGTSHRLLVMISDGLPYEEGYEARYAEEDTRRALAEAVESGVGCVCISVQASAEPEQLARLWGNASYLHLEQPTALGAHVEMLFRTALKSALEGSHGSAGGRSSDRKAGARLRGARKVA